MFKKLKDMFSSSGPSDEGKYFYVKLDRSGEIVQIRLDPRTELVPDYDNGGYYSRKTIVGPETYARAEATFVFDQQRHFLNADISGGHLVDREAWEAQQA